MEGDIKNAVVSAIAVIPGAGDAVAIGRVAHKGGKYLDKGKGIIDAATKGGKGSREIILEKEKTYERARNVLMEELDKTGRFKNGSKANFGSLEASYGYGKIIGRISYDKKVSWRLDYDPEKGVHFNIEDISNGKRSKRIKLAIPIDISEDEYRRIIDSWNGGQR